MFVAFVSLKKVKIFDYYIIILIMIIQYIQAFSGPSRGVHALYNILIFNRKKNKIEKKKKMQQQFFAV